MPQGRNVVASPRSFQLLNQEPSTSSSCRPSHFSYLSVVVTLAHSQPCPAQNAAGWPQQTDPILLPVPFNITRHLSAPETKQLTVTSFFFPGGTVGGVGHDWPLVSVLITEPLSAAYCGRVIVEKNSGSVLKDCVFFSVINQNRCNATLWYGCLLKEK